MAVRSAAEHEGVVKPTMGKVDLESYAEAAVSPKALTKEDQD